MTTRETLLAKDWSGKTVKEIARETGRAENTIHTTIRKYEAETGSTIPHKKPLRIIDKILAMDCKDMTSGEIAAKLGENKYSVETAIYAYRKKTGQEIPHKKVDGVYPRPGSLLESLLADDWSDLTASQIAEVMGTTPHHVRTVFRDYKKRTGEEIPHKRGGKG